MVKKVVHLLIIAAVIVAVWRLSNGDIGSFALSVWDAAIFPVVSFLANIFITIYDAVVSLF